MLSYAPLRDIPKDAHAVMSEHRIFGNAVNICFHRVVRVNISDKGVWQMRRQFILKFQIELFALRRVLCMSGRCQDLIDCRIGISGIIVSRSGREYLVGMIIRVERTAPTDDAGFLSGPVQALPRFRADIRANLLQLAGSHRSHIHTHLIVCHR